MIPLLLVLALVGFGASYVRRGWLAIPLSLLIPAVPTAVGAFDDGESLVVIAFWFALWPISTAIGLAAGSVFKATQPTY